MKPESKSLGVMVAVITGVFIGVIVICVLVCKALLIPGAHLDWSDLVSLVVVVACFSLGIFGIDLWRAIQRRGQSSDSKFQPSTKGKPWT